MLKKLSIHYQLWIAALVAVLVLFLAPPMVSAKSWELMIGGFALCVFGIYTIAHVVINLIKHEGKKDEKN